MGTNTGLGIGIGIPFKNNALGGDKPYFPPELKARMIGVWTNYGKKNTDADRNIIKNKIPNAGGDLEILNAAYKLNSGFGEYSEDFTTWTKSSKITSVNSESFSFASNVIHSLLYYKSNIGKDIPSFKIRIKLDKKGGDLYYNYINSEGRFINTIITGEEYVTPVSYNTKYIGKTPVNCGFSVTNITSECSGTITQIPNFEDAFVSDGINDMIVSQKTLQEMGVTKGLTIVSMIHQINTNEGNFITTNNLRNADKVVGRNIVTNIDKTGIYGWYKENIEKENIGVINNILGDKADYVTNSSPNTNTNPITNSRFYVTGYAVENSFTELSSVAHYWTFAVLGKATEDEINLIIGNYNLDRSLKPDILCNIGKQGITNENHAEFNDKLIDYSGNGRDIQMNNLAWKGGSGIAAKPFETIKDYTIVSDEARQKLTIYNEFSYKIKSNTPSCYWTVQSIIRDNTSYQVTIITDKDCYWINATSFINSEGNKESIRKKYPVLANTPTQVIICGLDQFEYPEGIEPTNAVSYVNLEYAGEITITFIPSHKGGLLLDGINDFGKVTGMPIYKDYTVVTDREIFANIGAISSKNNPGAFVETAGNSVYSFGQATSGLNFISTRSISYLSKYSYCGQSITAGAAEDGTDMWLGTIRDNDSRFFNGAIYSLMTFPYSMSEFLIERQLKKHKLGTLYPDMVEFRPIVNSNVKYQDIIFRNSSTEEDLVAGQYYDLGTISIFIKPLGCDEATAVKVNNVDAEFNSYDKNSGYYRFDSVVTKSPQKINITIDEYIRFEDIVQPYPSLFTLIDNDTEEVYSWGSKLKVGAKFKGNVVNLLPDMYEWQGDVLYNGEPIYWNTTPGVVAKEMTFSWNMPFKYLKTNAPKCIFSPSKLRMPNESYRYLGYIPDISGHGNHGVIHNSAYAEGSGVNEDGSYQFDGVDDFVTIPTLSRGGKQMLMKVNWHGVDDEVLYDQRNSNIQGNYDLAISTYPDTIAYNFRNEGGKTFIDGILNSHIITNNLKNITHNISSINGYNNDNNSTICIGKSVFNGAFAQMALYDFMLFDNISTDDKIKELNEYVGIEAKVELPPYYWDAYGKTNSDADRDTIQQRGVAVGNYDLTNYNHAYDKMSGYGGYKFAKFDNTIEWFAEDSSMVVNRNGYLITLKKVPNVAFWRFRNTTLKSLDNPLTFKVKCNKPIDVIFQVKFAKNNDVSIGYNYNIKEVTLVPNESTTIIVPSVSVSDIPEATSILFINVLFDNTSLSDNEEYTVEMLPLYPNGLLYDAVTDYSENVNIPVFTDFTAIMKRKWLKNQGCPLIKGSKVYEGGNGNALLFEWDKAYNFVFYKRTDIMEGEVPDNISFITPTNYNGNVITRGSEQDTNGICIAGDGNAGFANIVFYKLILYPKTIPLLQINFLKNLMEKDEIIDLTNPIFIKDE